MSSLTFFLIFHTLVSLNKDIPLQIKFEGIENAKGNVRLRIVDQENTVIREDVVKAKPGLLYEIKLNRGQYAVSAFHDENNNSVLDKNFLGIPQEKYGFSNDARGTFGPPELREQLFTHSAPQLISIRLF